MKSSLVLSRSLRRSGRTVECRLPSQCDCRLASIPATHFSLCLRHRHVTPSHHFSPRPSSALTDWWFVSAAQPFLPFAERVEGKGEECRLHSLTFIFYWLEWMPLTSRRRDGAVIGDDWFRELSVKAGAYQC